MSIYTTKANIKIEVEAIHYDTADTVAILDTDNLDCTEGYSVYLRKSNGEAVCIADFDTELEAIEFAKEFE